MSSEKTVVYAEEKDEDDGMTLPERLQKEAIDEIFGDGGEEE
jgi:hypothetical protein